MAPIAHQPVLAPLTWSNMTDADAEFEWSYTDPETGETATSDDQYELTVSYLPDYSDESTMRNNFILPPTLTATAPGSAPGSYTAPYVFFQAGGKAERRTAQGEFEFTCCRSHTRTPASSTPPSTTRQSATWHSPYSATT